MSQAGYIRGGGGVSVDARRLGMGLAAALVLVLAACTLWQVLSAASENSHADRLRRAGVPVQVTVTGCSGISSGIGMGVEFYECHGTYDLDGTTATGVIHGSRVALPTGEVISGLVVPSDPSTLTRTGPGASALPSGSLGTYAVAFILGAVTLLGAGGLVIWYRRSPGGHRAGPGAQDTAAEYSSGVGSRP